MPRRLGTINHIRPMSASAAHHAVQGTVVPTSAGSHHDDLISQNNRLPTPGDGGGRKTNRGRRGDPRMNCAVAAKLEDPQLSLLDTLRFAGFVFHGDDGIRSLDGLVVDADGVTLHQRKNQLCRRLRKHRKGTGQPLDVTTATPSRRHSPPPAATMKGPRLYPTPKPVDVSAVVDAPPTVDDETCRSDDDVLGLDDEGAALGFDFDELTFDAKSCPVFTEDDERAEKAGLTNDERWEILSDLVGKRVPIWREKVLKQLRAREGAVSSREEILREVSRSIRILTEETRDHAELLLVGEDLAEVLIPAVRGESRERLELFLIREDMDSKTAAKRLVNYWTKRFQLFGPAKYRLPMTVQGALRDDGPALATGTFQMLPGTDASGRKILYKAYCHHTSEGYTGDSMVRAMWYIFETLLDDPDTRKGIVLIAWEKHTTLWNYDRYIAESLSKLERDYMPLKINAIHVCSTPILLLQLLKPVAFALMDRKTRSRTRFLMGSQAEQLASLQSCGIAPCVVPKEMGGKSNFDYRVWLSERVAVGK